MVDKPNPIEVPDKSEQIQPPKNELNLLDLVGRFAEAARDAVQTSVKNKLAVDEFANSIERLHEPLLDPQAVKLASTMGRAIACGDVAALQKAFNENHDKPEWDETVEELAEQLEENGIWLTFNEKEKTLQLMRGPSFWVKGPGGVAFQMKAGEDKISVFKVEDKQNRKPFDPEPWALNPSNKTAEAAALDLSKTVLERMTMRREGIEAAKKAISEAPDLKKDKASELLLPKDGQIEIPELPMRPLPGKATGKEPVPSKLENFPALLPPPPPMDKETAAVIALLDKRFGPIIKTVAAARTEEERKELVAKLNHKAAAAGLFVHDSENGLVIGCHAEGTADGYAVVVPHDRTGAVHGLTGNNPNWYKPGLIIPTVHRIGKEKDEAISAPKAMREIADRLGWDHRLKSGNNWRLR